MIPSEPKVRPIQKLFIANRGEIAARIIRTASKMGIDTIGIVSKNDPISDATIKITINGENPSGVFLNPHLLIELALKHGADAIHPGYGYLSENSNFARLTQEAGLVFIGPLATSIEKMGNKNNARNIATELNIPIAKAVNGSISNIIANSQHLPYPLLVKAAAGGGGKGMLPVYNQAELEEKLLQTSREALNYFGNGSVFVEQYIEAPRHIEVQVLGDQYGHLIHLNERECSIQRRYQKIIEEAPSPFINSNLRQKLTQDALKIAKAIDYHNAGTIEFLVDALENHYFLEMNTRIQVEHPVTEAITGVDIVEEQLKIAMGYPLMLQQEDVLINGHAIECRIYAEDAENNFSPSPGFIYNTQWPSPQLARTDTWFNGPIEVSADYDPMVAKILTHGTSRVEAVSKAISALNSTHLTGLVTNIPFLKNILAEQDFMNGETHTDYCRLHPAPKISEPDSDIMVAAYLVWLLNFKPKGETLWHQTGYWRMGNQAGMFLKNQLIQCNWKKSGCHSLIVNTGNQQLDVSDIHFNDKYFSFSTNRNYYQFYWYSTTSGELLLEFNHKPLLITPDYCINKQTVTKNHSATELIPGNTVTAPIPGKITAVLVSEGSFVNKGDKLITLEAMKMENHILAPFTGKIGTLYVKTGQQVKARELLITLEPIQEPEIKIPKQLTDISQVQT